MDTVNKSRDKNLGIYYTPQYIIDFILTKVFELCGIDGKNPFDLAILDPSCGNGLFLLAVLKHLASEKNENPKANYLKNIYGIDIDPEALEHAKTNLQIYLRENDTREILSKNIKCGNSLIDDPVVDPVSSFIWEKEFPIPCNSGGFDVIVGNPPWVGLKGKQSPARIDPGILDYFLNRYPCDKYRPNLFEIFIWKSLELLKDNGYLGFIIPDRLCTNEQFSGLRKHLLANTQIKYLWFRPEFDKVISDNVVLILKKSKPDINDKILIADFPSKKFKEFSASLFLSDKRHRFSFIDEQAVLLINKIRKSDLTFNLNERFITGVGFIGKKGTVTPERLDMNQIPVVKGKNINKFLIKNNSYFEFKKDNIIGGSSDMKKLSVNYKVFIRKTGDRIIAVYDDTGMIPEQSVYFIYPKNNDPHDLMVLSAILNSKLMNYYYTHFAVTNRGSMPQLKKVDLDKFPIVFPRNDSALLSIARKIYKISDTGIYSRDEVSTLIKEMDREIYKIYDLTEQEIETIERK